MSQKSKNQRQQGKPNQNEHIPRYIKTQPWFYEQSGSQDYLIHHRQSQDKKNLFDIENNQVAKIGLDISDRVIKRRLDTKHGPNEKQCDNCGQWGHLKKDCLERPKKTKHKQVAEEQNASVEIRDDDNLNYDAKKDRWFGYTGDAYDQVVNKWEVERKADEETANIFTSPQYDRDEEIELFKLGLMKDSKGLLRQREISEQERQLGRTSVRLREDKAAYLNDINSSESKYDPKSRIYKSEDTGYIDEKSKMFRRHLTGEGLQLEQLSQFNRQHARQEGIKDAVQDRRKLEHVLIANPTKYEKLMKESQQEEAKKAEKSSTKDYSQLEAQKIEGKKYDAKTKKTLDNMYD